MTIRIAHITIDCVNAVTLANFWAAALGVSVDPDDRDAGEFFQSIGETTDGWSGPILMFLKVPETKAVKNRVHLDLHADDSEDEVARLLALGATHVNDKDEWGSQWTTLADPEGNEFCVAAG